MLLWGVVATGGAPWVMAGAGWAMVCTALFTNIKRDKELSLHDAFRCIFNYYVSFTTVSSGLVQNS